MRAPRTPMNGESEFIALSERVLEAIASALDAADADVEWTLNDGVLTLDCASAGKLIINRHLPSQEIWVAAKSGGFHFRRESGAWRDTKDGTELGAALERLLRTQAAITIAMPAPPAV